MMSTQTVQLALPLDREAPMASHVWLFDSTFELLRRWKDRVRAALLRWDISEATHIAIYGPHFDVLGVEHKGIEVVDGLTFLRCVRGASF